MTDLRKAAEMALNFIVVSSAKDKAWYTTEEFELVSALRQALAQPVDAVNMSQERVDETTKNRHEPVAGMFEEKLPDQNPPPWSRSYRLKRDWVGLTGNEARKFYEKYTDREELIYAIDKFLEEKNGG